MYLEATKEQYKFLKEQFDAMKISYIEKDFTNNPKLNCYYFEFENDAELAKKIYDIYEESLEQSNQLIKKNTWYEKYHTLSEEIAGHFTGKAQEEEWIYE